MGVKGALHLISALLSLLHVGSHLLNFLSHLLLLRSVVVLQLHQHTLFFPETCAQCALFAEYVWGDDLLMQAPSVVWKTPDLFMNDAISALSARRSCLL